MNKKDTTKKMLIEQVKKTPIFQAVCEKLNVPRGTVYRWKNEDPEFAKAFNEAMDEGISMVSDAAISQLLTAIKGGDLSVIKYWLNHFDENFKTKVEFSGSIRHFREELSEEEALVISDALNFLGLPEVDDNMVEGIDKKLS